MLEIKIPEEEYFDEINQEFVSFPGTLHLEHSLISLSKWEMKYKRPFMTNGPATRKERLDYYRFMCLDRNIHPVAFYALGKDEEDRIRDYMNDSMTASWFSDLNRRRSREIITNEVIYSWMVALGIPFECEKWHLNRLMVLIRMCSEDEQKMSKNDIYEQNRALNAARRAKLGTRG